MSKINIIEISKENIKFFLSKPRSKVRITDENGNHANKPTTVKNISLYYIEWMISNAEIQELVNNYLNNEERKKLANKLKSIDYFLNKSKFATRKAKKTVLLDKFKNFNIFEYTETFFSFEKRFDSDIKIRITFKMGDFTLAPHMFILFPFKEEVIKLSNYNGAISKGEYLGSGCFAIWLVSNNIICEAIESLAHASENHKKDLIAILELIK